MLSKALMGTRAQEITKTMSTSTTFNQTQRTAFENTLREQLREAQRTLGVKTEEARTTVLQKLLQGHEAVPLVNQIKACREEIETSEDELKDKGFELGHRDEVRIADESALE